MNRNEKREMCRQMLTSSLRRRQSAVTQLLRHATVVSDPQKMAALNAAVARRKIEK
jgi:hypothetical protein